MSFRLAALIASSVVAVSCSPTNASLEPTDDGLSGGATGGTGAGGRGAAPLTLPCEVQQIFERSCHECHGPAKAGGAPMSLASWEDGQAMSVTPGNEGKKIWERVGERIHDPLNPMPPRAYQALQLTPGDLAMLDAWVAQGGPPGTSCAPPAGWGGSTNGGGGTNGTGGGTPGTGGTRPGGGGTGNGGSGGSDIIVLEDGGILEPDPVDTPVEPDPSECTWVDIAARADANGTPFTVAANAFEQYRCFGFNIPEFETQKTQGLAFYTIHEAAEAPVVHHWLLYQAFTPQVNGQSADCLGTHLDAALVAGWAPGAGPWFLPEHVGIDLGPNFILEIHYNNPGGPATPNQSGVRMCTTNELRPETASVSWLGSDFFPAVPPGAQGHETRSRCTPQISEPIHILRTWPHMHLLGRHMTAELFPAGGGAPIPYHDQIFDFNYQVQYNTPIVMHPGDSIETTCVYDNPTANFVGFGEATSQEMCYNFTVAYPAGALKNALPSVHTNACLNEPAP